MRKCRGASRKKKHASTRHHESTNRRRVPSSPAITLASKLASFSSRLAMTDTALGQTAVAQLAGGTDEAIFAGLLLLTKCSQATLRLHAAEASSRLLGPMPGGGFIMRLLVSKPQEGDDEGSAPLLSQMQGLALHVTSALCTVGGAECRLSLARALLAPVTAVLEQLLEAGAMPVVGPDARGVAELEDVLECLHALLIAPESEDGACVVPWPRTLVPTLARILRLQSATQLPLSPPSETAATPPAAAPAAATMGGGGSSKVASLSVDLVMLLCTTEALPLGSGVTLADRVADLEAMAGLADGVGVGSSNHRGSWQPSKDGTGMATVALALDLMVQWCCAKLAAPINPALVEALEVSSWRCWRALASQACDRAPSSLYFCLS